MAKSESTATVSDLEPFVAGPNVSCKAEIREWFKKRWKTSWANCKDCLRTKEHVRWASPRLSQRLIGLSRRNLNQVLQVLTGHCNLGRGKLLDAVRFHCARSATWRMKYQTIMLVGVDFTRIFMVGILEIN